MNKQSDQKELFGIINNAYNHIFNIENILK